LSAPCDPDCGDQSGLLKDKLAYDAWGKRRTTDGSNTTPNDLEGKIDSRGYTGHEMLDQLDLVHMNGRVYDPAIGRFLTADPVLQDPMNGQSYNRYSYVLNNPTNLTDPSGFESCPKSDGETCATGDPANKKEESQVAGGECKAGVKCAEENGIVGVVGADGNLHMSRSESAAVVSAKFSAKA
jgi:RHS repeat-associated protein